MSQCLTCVGEQHLALRQLRLGELGHGVGGPGDEAHHAAVRARDAEGQVGVGAVAVHRPEVGVGDGEAAAGHHHEAGVVDQPRDGVIDGGDLEPEAGRDAGLVLVWPLQPRGPRHEHEAVLRGVAAVVNILKHGVDKSREYTRQGNVMASPFTPGYLGMTSIPKSQYPPHST